MAELVPYPFARLVTRAFAGLEQEQAIFHLPAKKMVRGLPGKDLSVAFHGHVASSPLGPAAGPHSQLAQNIVLSFLGGGRIFELKTVQIMDRLQIPRPCIDAQTIGYNVEWSQELTLEQSLEEYVKASMLIEILIASGKLELLPGFDRVVFDMSVGYDLAGIQSERVQAFLHGMLDATAVVERLRAQIPPAFARYRDLPFRTRVSDTLTLSTFHGCPPDEIERICEFLLEQVGLHTIVKLNPTLLGKGEVRRLLNDVLGYADHVPDEAFDKDASWEQAVGFVGRLGDKARALGRGFGVKFSNTLIVNNERSFFPESEKAMYLSGQPLHVLAMTLVRRFRDTFGDRFPISFSAGIDAKNFPDAVALGLTPVTVCTDLLRTGGYARLEAYFRELGRRMDAVGASSIDAFVQRASGQGVTEDVSQAKLGNTTRYVDALVNDPRYGRAATNKPPKKVGSHLVLFDCLTCDKCVPVCPNDANFTYQLPRMEVPIQKATLGASGAFEVKSEGTLTVEQKHQIANFADFCNECGNCDVFCPEDGGPYLIKPRFFGSREEFERHTHRDGFFVERTDSGFEVLGRFSGQAFFAAFADGRATYRGEGFELTSAEADPTQALGGRASGEVDLTYLRLMALLGRSVLERSGVSYVGG
ncbi:MAG: 4Fe-4S dicluster domain-containing protein [Polyangiaceae bacterium]|nr:4Fe-4S dicluster domain-containing protein [Polyangiaceae bacterium]